MVAAMTPRRRQQNDSKHLKTILLGAGSTASARPATRTARPPADVVLAAANELLTWGVKSSVGDL
jgi:hypothetical protein